MTAPWVICDRPLAARQLCDRIYAGEVLLFRGRPAVARLRAAAAERIAGCFEGLDPLKAQHALARDDFVARVDALQRDFARDPDVAELFRTAFADCGVALDRCYWDQLHLRVLPSGSGFGGPRGGHRIRTLKAHRDSWGANIPAQINWWAPIHPLTEGRTMALYPAYWDRPLANDSAGWDLEELRRRDRAARAAGLAESDYPRLPQAIEMLDRASEWRVLPAPDDLLCFSAAHLHATVPNDSGTTRFSLEARTVDLDDVRAHRGAPNLDGHAPRIPYSWFRHAVSGSSLADDLQVPA